MRVIARIAAVVMLLAGASATLVAAQAAGVAHDAALTAAAALMPAAPAAPSTSIAAGSAVYIDLRSTRDEVRLNSRTQRLDMPAELRPAVDSDALAHTVLQQNRRRGVTWLAVGGALLVAGMFIDGDAGAAVSVGGAIVGAYGIFLLVRQ